MWQGPARHQRPRSARLCTLAATGYTILSRATLQLLAQVAAAGQPGPLLPLACLAAQPHAVVAQLHADVAR